MKGKRNHSKYIIKNLNKGININKKSDLLLGKINSFFTNFKPSNKAWKSPKKIILFGPSRFCLKPKISRSNNVTKAIPKRIIITITTLKINNKKTKN